jgi:hypothetical protein
VASDVSLAHKLAALAAVPFVCSLVVALSSCEWHMTETILLIATGVLLAAAVRVSLGQSGWTAAGPGQFSALAVAVVAGLGGVVVNVAAMVAFWALSDCGGGA